MSTDTATTPAARVAAVHVADVVPSRYADQVDTWTSPDFTDDTTKIRLHSRHQGHTCTWTLLYVGPDGACRRVHQGPIEPGPYAALIPEATCISDTRLPGDRAAVVELAAGDLVIIRGVAFRIDDTRGRFGHNPQLIPVTA